MLTDPFSPSPRITHLDQFIAMKINSAKKTIHMTGDQTHYIFTMTVWLCRMMFEASAGKYSIKILGGILGGKECIPKVVSVCGILFHLGDS